MLQLTDEESEKSEGVNIEGGMTGAKDDEIDSDEEASSREGESENMLEHQHWKAMTKRNV